MAVLGNDDLFLRDQSACCRAGRFHQRLPRLALVAAGNGAGGFAGADGFASASFGEEMEDCLFEHGVSCGRLRAAALVAAELYFVPVLGPALAPLHSAAAGCARLGESL